jgi:hypothetical protein
MPPTYIIDLTKDEEYMSKTGTEVETDAQVKEELSLKVAS